jgi:hypothetical protein
LRFYRLACSDDISEFLGGRFDLCNFFAFSNPGWRGRDAARFAGAGEKSRGLRGRGDELHQALRRASGTCDVELVVLVFLSRGFVPASGSAARVGIATKGCSWLVMAPPTQGRVVAGNVGAHIEVAG